MLSRSFETALPAKAEPGLVCVGKFDGRTPALALATSGNRVLIHTSSGTGPRGAGGTETRELPPGLEDVSGVGDNVRFLNINRQITALAAAPLDKSDKAREMLLVGSESSLLAYDVHNNCDLFFVDITDCVHTLAFGLLPQCAEPLIFVGGNCSLQGFDGEGNEKFWTVIGGIASSLAFCDADRDGNSELVVGSDDFEIRAFQNEESAFEITETEGITHLCAMHPASADGGSVSRFAYGLKNGTIGIYDGQTRLWRVKSKERVLAMAAFDVDGDGVCELVTGWSDGKLEVRREDDGQVVHRLQLGSPIAALLTGDLRSIGSNELICCTQDGRIRGYETVDPSASSDATTDRFARMGAAMGGVVGGEESGFDGERTDALENQVNSEFAERDVMRALRNQPAGEDDRDETDRAFLDREEGALPSSQEELRDEALAALQEQLTLKRMELRSLNDSIRKAKAGNLESPAGAIPAGTQVKVSLRGNQEDRCLDLVCELNSSECAIQNVVVFELDAGVLPGECEMTPMVQQSHGTRATVQLRPLKNVATTLRVQTFVSARGSAEQLHVFEQEVELCKFATLRQVDGHVAAPQNELRGNVAFAIQDCSLEEVEEALGAAFDLPHTVRQPGAEDELFVHFVGLCDGQQLVIQSSQANQQHVRMKVECDTMELAAQIVQEVVAKQLGKDHLESAVDFPGDLRRLEGLMEQVTEMNSIRQRLSAEMADESNYIKSLVVKAEDARILGDITSITQTYQELTTLNVQLIGEYNKRSNNQENLLNTLKEVNQIIQWASLLRIGKPKAQVVSACRKAIKTSNLASMFHAITSMSAAQA
ncbi:Bardet-Biedl syndrome 2 protein [Durusdinium trenchii]|uniref:Bardet-Biedl syndrome 2 protein n=1 Tax=Durusdinium trenchii TaxID=1381693 RepID=A0ABP0L1N1_9DINO